MLDTISNNQILTAIVAGVVFLIIGWVVKYFKDMNDSGKYTPF
jgi:hypothetical protein